MLPVLLIGFPGPLRAQPGLPGEGPRAPGTTGDPAPYDTTAIREARERTLESSGLLEQPIDPEQYMLGPNDQLTVAIPTVDYKVYDLLVSPEGKVLIPRAGEVMLKGKSLAAAKALIRDQVERYYRVSDISVSLKKMRQFKVSLIGAVNRPGMVVATPTTRVSEVIDLGGGASALASKRNIAVIRNGRSIDVDLLPYYSRGDLASNPFVDGGDVIRVGVGDKKNVVAIYGAVQRPGEFPYHRGDSVSSLIRYAWGLAADARTDSIQLVSVNERGDTLDRVTLTAADREGVMVDDRLLRPGDRIFVQRLPDYLRVSQAAIAGEVVYPGVYPIEPGRTRLRDLITSANGFTGDASIPDAVLIRRQALAEPDARLELINRIDPEKRTEEEVEYLRVKSTERPGVMTVDVAALMAGRESENVVLIDRDSLYVPSKKDFIQVSGKVKNPGNVSFTAGAGYEHYLDAAGGYGWKADEGNTQIIKGKSGDTFLASSESKYVLEPGDRIYVPEEPPSDFWKGFASVITVIAQIGTIAAVVVSIAVSTKR
jgi:protein involved in polysaccharide export with SLBB domain